MQNNKIVAPTKINLKFILPLCLLYLTIYLAADSVAYKIIHIGNMIEPGPPFIFPLSYVVGAVIAEVYGSDIAKKLIWLTLICQLFYAISIEAIISLPYTDDVVNDSAYHLVFGNIVHFVISGTLAVVTSSFVNIYLVAKSKVLLDGKYYCLRNIVSTATGGFILILIIMLLVYLPELGFRKAIYMFFCIYALELAYTILLVFPSWIVCGLLKKYENLDVYDYNVRFNPFKFSGEIR